jgi:hypothetical protein
VAGSDLRTCDLGQSPVESPGKAGANRNGQFRTRARRHAPVDHPYAELDLIRQPEQANDPLQAFDAADEYLLRMHEQAPDANCRVLVLNDSFGALAASLAGRLQVVSSGDSHLAHLALEKNLARNGLPFDSVPFVPASEHWQGPFDRVLVRVPKTLALLEEQLIRLQGHWRRRAGDCRGHDQAPATGGR